jgi:hypothetical protein
MNKKLLVLRASTDIPDRAIYNIFCHAEDYDINAMHKDVKTIDELIETINNGEKYDYLYFAAHGSDVGFGDNNSFILSWEQIGALICESNCLNKNAIIMLYCCRGGLNQVAYQLIAACPNVQYVCGARQDMTNIDLTIGFSVFMYNIECRNIDPVLAAKRATKATEIRFQCFDRLEVEAEPMYYYNYCPNCVRLSQIYPTN